MLADMGLLLARIAADAARIRELEARQVPDGWQVVPKEPTGQMCWEGSVVEVKHLFDHDRSPHIGAKSSADVYRAMLAAAPRP